MEWPKCFGLAMEDSNCWNTQRDYCFYWLWLLPTIIEAGFGFLNQENVQKMAQNILYRLYGKVGHLWEKDVSLITLFFKDSVTFHLNDQHKMRMESNLMPFAVSRRREGKVVVDNEKI